MGDLVQAQDRTSRWLTAKVVDARIVRSRREVLVHFLGWARCWDEWVCASSKVRKPCDAARTMRDNDLLGYGSTAGRRTVDDVVVWDVDKLTASRVRAGLIEYRVKWAGSHDATWEPADHIMDAALVDAFNLKQAPPPPVSK